MECLIYDPDGAPRPVDGDAAALAARVDGLTGGRFAWITADEDDPRVWRSLLEAFAGDLTPPHAATGGAATRPRRERLGEYLYLTLRIIREGDTRPVPLRILAGPHFLATMCGDPSVTTAARERLAGHPRPVRDGPPGAVYLLAAVAADGYERAAEELRERLRDLEERVFAPGRGNLTTDIHRLKRAVLEVGDAVEPFTPIAKDLLGGPPPAGLSHHLRDLAHQVRHTEAAVTGIDTLLNSVADAHLTRVGIRQNEDMRRISAWAAILAGPTVIASVYGMDFERIPGLSWDHGYPVVAMLIPGLVIYIMFRRNKWL